MVTCWFCGADCDEDADEFSETLDCYLHLGCLIAALHRRVDYDLTLHRVAREFSMAGKAPGRKAFACPHGHPYTEENRYTSPTNRVKCRTCLKAAVQQRDPEKRRAYRRNSGPCLNVRVSERLHEKITTAAQGAGLGISPYVRGVVRAALPALEKG